MPTGPVSWLLKYSRKVVHHPQKSPDLEPSDSHMYGSLKQYLAG